jgi:hypothetical protein
MHPGIRTAMERRDANRGEWWLARKDTDPPGKWTLTADPAGDWDWRFKVGTSKCRAVARLRAAAEREVERHRKARAEAELQATREQSEIRVTAQGKVLEIRRIVDSIRTRSAEYQFGDGADK